MNAITAWFGQVTTGHGAAALGGTLLAVLTGQMSWQTAAPLLAVGAVLLLWPENSALPAVVQKTVTDLAGFAPAMGAEFRAVVSDARAIQQAYLTGVQHGNAAATPPAPTDASSIAGAAAKAAAIGLVLAFSIALPAFASPAIAAPAAAWSILLTVLVLASIIIMLVLGLPALMRRGWHRGFAALAIGSALLLGACAKGPDPAQALYAVETAYVLIANDETAAINTGLVPAAAVANIKATDNTLYGTLVTWRTAVEKKQSVEASTIAAANTGLHSLVDQLGKAHAIKPATQQAVDTALALLTAITGA